MKQTIKILFLSVILSSGWLFTNNLHAQEQRTGWETSRTPKVLIRGGLNLSNLYVNDVEDENLKAGLNIGIGVKLPVSQGFSVQPELLYSMKGAQLNYNNVLGSGKYKYNLEYLEVPVAAVFNVSRNFNIHLGPYVGFLLSARVKDVDQDGNINGVTELDKDNFRTTDYGLFGGIGFDIQNFTLGARYNYGLQEIGRTGLAGELTRNSKNSVLSFYIGVGL